jgi:hypothetical protein
LSDVQQHIKHISCEVNTMLIGAQCPLYYEQRTVELHANL